MNPSHPKSLQRITPALKEHKVGSLFQLIIVPSNNLSSNSVQLYQGFFCFIVFISEVITATDRT